jgi:hypothetical protein
MLNMEHADLQSNARGRLEQVVQRAHAVLESLKKEKVMSARIAHAHIQSRSAASSVVSRRW